MTDVTSQTALELTHMLNGLCLSLDLWGHRKCPLSNDDESIAALGTIASVS
jgi:hypothetical protein